MVECALSPRDTPESVFGFYRCGEAAGTPCVVEEVGILKRAPTWASRDLNACPPIAFINCVDNRNPSEINIDFKYNSNRSQITTPDTVTPVVAKGS